MGLEAHNDLPKGFTIIVITGHLPQGLLLIWAPFLKAGPISLESLIKIVDNRGLGPQILCKT